jgi:hypothetical protein
MFVLVYWNSFGILFSSLSFMSVNVDFVAQSLASGTVEDGEKLILSSLLLVALLETKRKYNGILGLK